MFVPEHRRSVLKITKFVILQPGAKGGKNGQLKVIQTSVQLFQSIKRFLINLLKKLFVVKLKIIINKHKKIDFQHFIAC